MIEKYIYCVTTGEEERREAEAEIHFQAEDG